MFLPYYLHLLDKVSGAAHFDINEQQAEELLKQMRHRLPGYLVPKLVKEEAGEPSKNARLGNGSSPGYVTDRKLARDCDNKHFPAETIPLDWRLIVTDRA